MIPSSICFDLKLAVSKCGIKLAKGAPDEITKPDPTPDGFGKALIYKGYDSYTFVILRGSEELMVVTDICDKGGYGRVLGFGEYSSEKDIIAKLGSPSCVSVNEQGTAKLLTYSRWHAAFEIEKGNVVEVCVTKRPQMRYSVEHASPETGSESKP